MNTKKAKEFLCKYCYILIFAVVVAAVAGLWSWQRGDKFDTSLALTVSRLGSEAATDYRYDNYYAVMASDQFGDTVVGWFKTPQMGAAIQQKTGFNYAGQSLNSLAGRFRATKLAPNVVEVRFGAKTQQEAMNLSSAVVSAIQEKISSVNSASNQGIAFAALPAETVVVKNSMAIWFNVLAGFLMGLVVGFFARSAREYLK